MPSQGDDQGRQPDDGREGVPWNRVKPGCVNMGRVVGMHFPFVSL